MTAKWLKHPITGLVYAATPALMARGDMIPCADESGAPTVTADEATALGRQAAELQEQLLLVQGDNAVLTERLTALSNQVVSMESQLRVAEEANAALRAQLDGGTAPAPTPAKAAAKGKAKPAPTETPPEVLPGPAATGDSLADELSQSGL